MKHIHAKSSRMFAFFASLLATVSTYADIIDRPTPAQETGVQSKYSNALSMPLTKDKIVAESADKEQSDADKEAEAKKAAEIAAVNQKKVYIADVEVIGSTLFDNSMLKSLISSDVAKDMNFEEITQLTKKITAYYHKQGYAVVKVFIPKNALNKDGVLTIQVLEGRLSDVEVTGTKRFSNEKIINTAYHYLEKDKPFKITDAERPLTLLNTMSGLSVSSTLSPGDEAGTTKLTVVATEPENQLRGSVEFNNFGSENSGEYRIIPYLALQNPFGIGDELSGFAVISPDMIDSWSYQINYKMPITDFGTSIKAYFGQGNNAVGNEYEYLDIAGDSLSWGAGFSHLFVFSARTTLELELMFDWQDLNQDMLSGSYTTIVDKVRKIRFGANFDRKDSSGRTFLSAYVHQGLGEFLDGMENNSTLSSRAASGADNEFTKFVFGAMRIQSICDRVYAILNATAQYSLDPLVSTEQIYLGGANSVRGQPYSMAYGDDGVIFNAEIRYAIIRDLTDVTLQLAGFFDYGMTHFKDAAVIGEESVTHAMGAGVGIRSQILGCMDLRLDVATPIGNKYGDSIYLYGQVRYGF